MYTFLPNWLKRFEVNCQNYNCGVYSYTFIDSLGYLARGEKLFTAQTNV